MRHVELATDLATSPAPFYRASAEVMADVVGFHLNRGVLGAARRCLLEELGLAVSEAELYESAPPYDRAVDSPSYPGLATVYHVHSVAVAADDLPGLPDADFWLDNTAPADPVRRHCWGWR